MRIVGVHLEPGPVGWHRCWNWTTAMQRLGHDVVHRPHVSDQFEWATVDKYLDGADVVVTSKMHHGQVFAALMAYRDVYGYKLVVDTDDAADLTPRYNQSFENYHAGAGLVRIVKAELREADLVTASTQILADHVRPINGNIVVIPNVVDTALHLKAKGRTKEARHANDIRIYWGGGGGHYDDLLLVKNALLRVFKENPNVKLVFSNFIPDWAIDLPPFNVFMIRFAHFNAYPKVLKWLCADVALAPLVDSQFNRCKSHVKYLDYAMADIPGVYSDLDPYGSVEDGVTGLKAKSESDWYEAITMLVKNADLRKSIAKAAKEDVLSKWTIDKWAPVYESMLKELVATKRDDDMVMLTEGQPIEVSQCLSLQS